MKIAIIGYGHVGKSVLSLFPDAYVYDPYLGMGKKEDLANLDCAFICVPTPSQEDGSCDTSIVEGILSWIEAKVIIIRSTVIVGFTEAMKEKYHKPIVFQPEYYGETKAHPYAEEKNVPWVTLGGDEASLEMAKKVYAPYIDRVHLATSKEAEMAKYMCNAFLANKVIFCNEIYDLCQKLDINYDHVKDLWLLDERIGKSHYNVYPDNRGYGGSCFPKDVKALIQLTNKAGSENDLLKSIHSANEKIKGNH